MRYINKHCLKMVGLKKACGMTKSLFGPYGSHYLQLNYNITTGEILVNEHRGFGHRSFTHYHDSDIKFVSFLFWPHTMQDLADMIADYIIPHYFNEIF